MIAGRSSILAVALIAIALTSSARGIDFRLNPQPCRRMADCTVPCEADIHPNCCCRWCPDGYCAKPLPWTPIPCGCCPDCYKPKPQPIIPHVGPRCCPDTYCAKPLPESPNYCEPWYQCGPVECCRTSPCRCQPQRLPPVKRITPALYGVP